MLTYSYSLVTLYRRANVSAFYAVRLWRNNKVEKKVVKSKCVFFLIDCQNLLKRVRHVTTTTIVWQTQEQIKIENHRDISIFHIYSILVDYHDISNIVRKLSQAILIPTKLGIISVKIMASPEVERSPLTSPTNHQSRGYPKSQSHLSNSGEKRKMLNFRYVIPFLSMAYLLAT